MTRRGAIGGVVVGICCCLGHPTEAKMPSGKLVMVDMAKVGAVTSKRAPDETHMTWRELIAAGINGVHFRAWTGTDDHAYTQHEWVREAHEYGLWVAGGTGNGVNEMIGDVQRLASMGVDFIQLDEPVNRKAKEGDFSLTNGDHYTQIRNAARSINANTPVVITDAFYNDLIGTWGGVDGLIQEVYSDDWHNKHMPKALSYKSAHPSQHVLMWVWLPTRYQNGEVCTVLPDSGFQRWFGDSFDRIGKILLFIWNSRTYHDCDWGAPWETRLETIRAKTAPYRVALPQWQNFSPSSPLSTGAPDLSVQVRSSAVGIDPGSVECLYSTDKGQSWRRWSKCACTGDRGTKDWQTITARGVPFDQVSDTQNLMRFKVKDLYSGSYYRGNRTDKMDFTVTIGAVVWQGLDSEGPFDDSTPDLALKVQDQVSGLDVSTVSCAYSTDGGHGWTSWAAESSGAKGTKAVETVKLVAVPFGKDSHVQTRVRCQIKNMAGADLVSPAYAVPIARPPWFTALTPRYTVETSPDCIAEVQDDAELIVGAAPGAADGDTALLLHLDGDNSDSSGLHNDAQVNGANWKTIDTWKSSGGQEQMFYFDGTGNHMVVPDLPIASSAVTIATWVQAENSKTAITYRGVGDRGGISFRFRDHSVWVSSRGKANLTVESPQGTFAQDGQWYHVAFTLAEGQARLYINGAQVAEGDWGSTFALHPGAHLWLGLAPPISGRFFTGYLDELSVHRRALSAAEVAAAYHSGRYRYSTDGGATWAVGWTPAKVVPQADQPGKVTLTAEGLPFEQLSEGANKVEFLVRDVNGNVVVREHVVRVVEQGHACLTAECGDGCGECDTGFNCTAGQCVAIPVEPDPVDTPGPGQADSPVTGNGSRETPPTQTALSGGCTVGQGAGPAASWPGWPLAGWPWVGLLALACCWRARPSRRRR